MFIRQCMNCFVAELGANIAGGVGGRGEREEESTSGVSTFNSQHSHPEEVHRFIERLESRDAVYSQLKQLEDENRKYVLFVYHRHMSTATSHSDTYECRNKC